MIEYENIGKLNQPFNEAFELAFKEVIDSGWYILGNKVKQFENEFAAYCQTKHCIGVANGLDECEPEITVEVDRQGSAPTAQYRS